jgi:hypothetical protein
MSEPPIETGGANQIPVSTVPHVTCPEGGRVNVNLPLLSCSAPAARRAGRGSSHHLDAPHAMC